MSHLPTVETLKRLLSYDPESGVLTWRERGSMDCPRDGGKRWNSRYAGQEAFRVVHTGYRQGMVNRVMVRAHRAAWAIYYGRWPDGDIDHINGNRSDNRIANLREVSRADNAKNQRPRKNSKSGILGVCRHGKDRWKAYIKVGDKPLHLGVFDSLDDAAEARARANLKYGYHPNHGKAAILPEGNP